MASNPDEKIQIVAFSTNDSAQTPNDIINIFWVIKITKF